MKNLLKVLFGIFVTLVYIPLSIVSSYTVVSTLTNIFNSGYESAVLNIIFGIIGLITLLFFVVLLEKIMQKVIEKKIRFMVICTVIPIIIFCIAMLFLNFNFFDLQKEVKSVNLDMIGESGALSAALMSLSSVFIILSFMYLIVFVMYIFVYKISRIRKNKSENNK